MLTSILSWLRSGYPEGVPAKDYFPLLALLRRTLSPEAFTGVARILGEDDEPVLVSEIRDALERVTHEEPNEDEVRQVAARLAAAGWPLSGGAMRLAAEDASAVGGTEPPPTAAEPEPEKKSLIERILDWLRIGYPEGVPSTDYVPLLALLRRRITDDELGQVADALIAAADAAGEVSSVDAQVIMSKVLNDLPSEDDLNRVRERLAAAGVELV